MPIQNVQPDLTPQKQPSPTWQALKLAYRVFNVVSLVTLVVMIFLVLRKSPAPQVATDPKAAQRVEEKFLAADQAKASGQPAQVALDSTELNSYLSANLGIAAGATAAPQADAAPPAAGAPEASAPSANATPGGSLAPAVNVPGADPQTIEAAQQAVKDVKVDMDGDLVKAYVVFNLHGQDLSLELDGHLGAEDGYMKFEPVAGKLGSLPLPQAALEEAVEKMMNSPENREKLRLPPDISDVQIQNGQAVVTYK
jgi:hypothetical protein